jgi:potassium efflux system protein
MLQLRQFIIFAFGICLFFAHSALAQTEDIPGVSAPDFTAQSLEQRIEILKTNEALSAEQRAQAEGFYRTATDRLSEATRQAERRSQYLSDIENIVAQREALDAQIETAQAALEATTEPMGEMIGEGALFALEQDLIARESELAEVETQLTAIIDAFQALIVRQSAAPKELAESRSALGALQAELTTLGEGDLEEISNARRAALQARAWYRRNQIRALEQEIASLPLRQEILGGRRALADLKVQRLRADVQRLAERTGQKRINEADALRTEIAAQANTLAEAHPLVASFATDNLALAEEIAGFAAQESDISQSSASVRGRALNVENDLTAARRLVKIGNLDREAGATLRRLGNQLQAPARIRADTVETQSALSKVTRQRIVAQENLRDLPIGGIDMDSALQAARRDAPDLPDFTSEDRVNLRATLDTRRSLLRRIETAATARITDLADLESAQEELLAQTEELQTLLDENLLWVRSVPAIDVTFPKKVALGALELVSVGNLRLAVTELLAQAQRLWLIVFIFLGLVIALFRIRPSLRENMIDCASKVGRVRDDSAWHTPAVILGGILQALPFPLIFFLIAILYSSSINPDRLIEGLAHGFLNLSIFALVFLTWIRWDADKGLFSAHFNLSDALRRTVGANLRWFVPVVGTSTVFLAVMDEMTSVEITEGLSVFTFLLMAAAIMIFAWRVLWAKRKEIPLLSDEKSSVARFRGPIALFAIGLPLVAIGLAITGYYESAVELLSRVLITGWVVLLTYVIYGAIRRAIVVAQRQIKYRQAKERHEAELKARREKVEAEERGEEMPAPPPIDTAEIDVSTMTRQTSQLLRTAMFLGFVVWLWMIWSPLLPALSIFDGFEIWQYEAGTNPETNAVIIRAVSVWDLLQAAIIVGLTFIAARNLPGFLEIFVLNRLGVDAGTRYAVVTVVGYIIVGIGVIVAFNQLGLQWSQLKWIVTGLSVGIGLGLQKIIANFVSGLIILFERPIRIGDYVTIGDQSGTVSRIKIRATTLKDLDNLEILIPNEAVISERVTNWTLTSSITRLMVPVGIAYGSDTDHARDLMLETLKNIPKVLDNPAPQVLFMGFGDSALDFQCRIFLRNFEDRVPMIHTVHTEINKTLAAAGISIPFPQRDLNIVSQDIPLQVMSKSTSQPKRKSNPSAGASTKE